MRTLFTFMLLAVATAGNAQLNFYVKGGLNSTNTHLVNVKYGDGDNHLRKTGWQLGVQAEYGQGEWMAYTGLSIDKKAYTNYHKGNSSDYDFSSTYRPTFITLPVGFIRSYILSKNLGLRFYAGLYASVGVAGKDYFYTGQGLIDIGPPGPQYDEAKIAYGKDGDLTTANWGVQFGVGVLTRQKFELVAMYSSSLSNIQPGGDEYDQTHLGTISLDFKVNLKAFAKTGKK